MPFPVDTKLNSTSTKEIETGNYNDAASSLLSKAGWEMISD